MSALMAESQVGSHRASTAWLLGDKGPPPRACSGVRPTSEDKKAKSTVRHLDPWPFHLLERGHRALTLFQGRAQIKPLGRSGQHARACGSAAGLV